MNVAFINFLLAKGLIDGTISDAELKEMAFSKAPNKTGALAIAVELKSRGILKNQNVQELVNEFVGGDTWARG